MQYRDLRHCYSNRQGKSLPAIVSMAPVQLLMAPLSQRLGEDNQIHTLLAPCPAGETRVGGNKTGLFGC